MSTVLIIDADERFTASLSSEIARMGHKAEQVYSLVEGLELAVGRSYDVVFLHTDLPDGKSMDALPSLLEAPSSPEVIVLADPANPDEAERSIRMGAWHYFDRRSTVRTMTLSLVRALQYRAQKIPRETRALLKKETFEEIVGSSTQINRCLELVALTANGDANVLLAGETGTGKELFAWAIHNNSRRSSRNFVVVDCAALPETLVESTLFGYEKGAFTGADKTQSGLIKRADGGTLFLDEVGELPLSVQKSFLRVLQERRFRQVGGGAEIESDFRLIAASNCDLDTMVHRHRFRKDLLFRLRAFTMDLPPLRDHVEDVKELAVHHLGRLCQCYGLPEKDFSPDFFDVLSRYDWPGNVRELVNALDRAVSAARHEPVIFPKHLPIYIRVRLARASAGEEDPEAGAHPIRVENSRSLPKLTEMRESAIAEAEQRYLKELVSLTSDMAEASRICGLSRSRLYALLKKYNITSRGQKFLG